MSPEDNSRIVTSVCLDIRSRELTTKKKKKKTASRMTDNLCNKKFRCKIKFKS